VEFLQPLKKAQNENSEPKKDIGTRRWVRGHHRAAPKCRQNQTLLNHLVGPQKIAIVTSKPQTTRKPQLQGIVTQKKKGAAKIVFIDTPGLHDPD